MATKLDERFFSSTRGRVVALLRGGASTVADLAAELGLTDNAVRAHLLTLERDGLVRQAGTQRGLRKPHYAYELAPEAERLFPKAYDLLLNQLIGVLKRDLGTGRVEAALREVGRSLAAGAGAGDAAGDLERRAEGAVKVLESLGGSARLEREGDLLLIRSNSCPLASVVAEHPEVCRLAESLVTEIVGAPVRERCDRDPSPRCRFEIAAKAR